MFSEREIKVATLLAKVIPHINLSKLIGITIKTTITKDSNFLNIAVVTITIESMILRTNTTN